MSDFLEQLDEAFSNVSFMDVSELRTLYYGRINLYVSFSDDGEHDLSGFDGGVLMRPRGVLSHTIHAVVGRKVSTPYFYANVFRNKAKASDILDTSTYSYDNFREDVETLTILPYLDEEDVRSTARSVSENVRLRSYFERFWVLTRELSNRSDARWAEIILDAGYSSIEDPIGKGIISPDRSPSTIILDLKNVMDLDIVPVQKYRKDRRQNVIRRINKKNKRLWATRNRIAKRRTDKYRQDSNSVANSVAEFRQLVLGI